MKFPWGKLVCLVPFFLLMWYTCFIPCFITLIININPQVLVYLYCVQQHSSTVEVGIVAHVTQSVTLGNQPRNIFLSENFNGITLVHKNQKALMGNQIFNFKKNACKSHNRNIIWSSLRSRMEYSSCSSVWSIYGPFGGLRKLPCKEFFSYPTDNAER